MRVFVRDWISDFGLLPVLQSASSASTSADADAQAKPHPSPAFSLKSVLKFAEALHHLSAQPSPGPQTLNVPFRLHRIDVSLFRRRKLPETTFPFSLPRSTWLALAGHCFGLSVPLAQVYWDFFCTLLGPDRCFWESYPKEDHDVLVGRFPQLPESSKAPPGIKPPPWTHKADPLVLDILLLAFAQLMSFHHKNDSGSGSGAPDATTLPPSPAFSPRRLRKNLESAAASHSGNSTPTTTTTSRAQHHPTSASSTSSNASSTSPHLPAEIAMQRNIALQFWKTHTGAWLRTVGVLRRGARTRTRSQGWTDDPFDGLDVEVGEAELCDALDRVFFGVGPLRKQEPEQSYGHHRGLDAADSSPPPAIPWVLETPSTATTHHLNDLAVVDQIGAYLARSLSQNPGPTAGKVQGVIAWMLEDRGESIRRLKISDVGVAMSIEECGDGPFFQCDPVLISRKKNLTIVLNLRALLPDLHAASAPPKLRPRPQKAPTFMLHRLINCSVHIMGGPVCNLLVSRCRGLTHITGGPVLSRLHIQGDQVVGGEPRGVNVSCPAGVVTVAMYPGQVALSLGDEEGSRTTVEEEQPVLVATSTPVRPIVWTIPGSKTHPPSSHADSMEDVTPSATANTAEPQLGKRKSPQCVFSPLDMWHVGLAEDLEDCGWDQTGVTDRWNEAVDLGFLATRQKKPTVGNQEDEPATEQSGEESQWPLADVSLLPPSKYYPAELPVQIVDTSINATFGPGAPKPPTDRSDLHVPGMPVQPPSAYAAWALACIEFVKSARGAIDAVSYPPAEIMAAAAEGPAVHPMEGTLMKRVVGRFEKWLQETGKNSVIAGYVDLQKDLTPTGA
ncbi:hypothetical protein HDU96_006634 [Phlyctochytrium bullatum]|nr:hypothetical protein HDU96_006634 [Phlyctochytrium bullatum]